jgi:AraC-like DNA-binding protein
MLLYLTLSTIVIALFLLVNNYGKNKHALCVSLFLCIVSLYGLAHYLVLFGYSAFWLAVFYNHFTPLYLLLGPFLLFYVRGVLFDTECISKKDLLHGIPALIQLVGIVPYIMKPFATKLHYANLIITDFNNIIFLNLNLFYNADISFLIRVGLFFVYILYTIYLLLRHLPEIKKQRSVAKKQFTLSGRWLWILVSCSLVITVYFIVMTLLSFVSTPEEAFNNSYWLHLASGIAYFVMTFSLLVLPEILYGMPRQTLASSSNPKEELQQLPITRSLALNTNDPMLVLSEKIIHYMENEKPYIAFDFSIASLAFHFKVPQHHISYCINTILQSSFYKLRGEYRVKYAIQLLKEDTKMSLTMEAIGEQAGFSTRSNFYKTFKEFMGVTPLEYAHSLDRTNS